MHSTGCICSMNYQRNHLVFPRSRLLGLSSCKKTWNRVKGSSWPTRGIKAQECCVSHELCNKCSDVSSNEKPYIATMTHLVTGMLVKKGSVLMILLTCNVNTAERQNNQGAINTALVVILHKHNTVEISLHCC